MFVKAIGETGIIHIYQFNTYIIYQVIDECEWVSKQLCCATETKIFALVGPRAILDIERLTVYIVYLHELSFVVNNLIFINHLKKL
jgi:hypothetical protein